MTPEQPATIQLRVVEPASEGGWGFSFFWLLPLVFIGFLLLMMFRGSGGAQQMGGQNSMNMAKSRARKITADQPSVKFDDVAGSPVVGSTGSRSTCLRLLEDGDLFRYSTTRGRVATCE